MSFAIPSADVGATPLGVLPAIALDTETTGLDVATARVVEIGAIRLWGNAQKAASTPQPSADIFEKLVAPGVPIPPVTTAVHGITDADVAMAPAFKVVMQDGLELITIRYFDDATIARTLVGKKVLMEIKSGRTVQMVVRDRSLDKE